MGCPDKSRAMTKVSLKLRLVRNRTREQLVIQRARNFDGAEARQMRGQELRVEQAEPAALQSRHQMHQRHFARVPFAREHALAEERTAQLHTIKTARQFAVAPAFDGM